MGQPNFFLQLLFLLSRKESVWGNRNGKKSERDPSKMRVWGPSPGRHWGVSSQWQWRCGWKSWLYFHENDLRIPSDCIDFDLCWGGGGGGACPRNSLDLKVFALNLDWSGLKESEWPIMCHDSHQHVNLYPHLYSYIYTIIDMSFLMPVDTVVASSLDLMLIQ